ncbi:hypothetical protein HYX70_02280 [Candidatus Saccharibacteria bacterium]|nr:hypothetical protein [Candidatus Saccharibacteria bacterium]
MDKNAQIIKLGVYSELNLTYATRNVWFDDILIGHVPAEDLVEPEEISS